MVYDDQYINSFDDPYYQYLDEQEQKKKLDIKNLDKKAKFKPKRKLKFFKDRVLFKNSRINVKEGQKVSELFTPRAIENIDLILEAISKLNKKQKRIARFC